MQKGLPPLQRFLRNRHPPESILTLSPARLQKDLDPLQRLIQEEEERRTIEEAERKAVAARSEASVQGEDGREAGRKPGARTAAAGDAKAKDAKGMAPSAPSGGGGGGGGVRRGGYSAEEETRWRRSMNVIDTVLQQ